MEMILTANVSTWVPYATTRLWMKAVSGSLIELLSSKCVPAGFPTFAVVMVLRTIVVLLNDVLCAAG